MSTELDPGWQLNPGCTLHWQSWGDEHVVYCADSGDTHLLDAITAQVLRCLEESSVPSADLVQQIAVRLGYEPDPDFHNFVQQALERLHRLGLVAQARA